MKRIFRYELDVKDETSIDLPRDAEILTFACRDQHPDKVEFWALVDDEKPTEERIFRVLGTGHPFKDSDEWRYLDTVITARGALVWHIFRTETMTEFSERTGY